MTPNQDSLVFSKSLALIQKTRKRVSQVDGTDFPTVSSEHARNLLLDTLDALSDRAFWPAMNPEALYSSLIHIQGFVDQLEASNSAHISWPLVSCCDHIWDHLFPKREAQIFYTVMTEHNYGIDSFSTRLKQLIEKVLPPSQISKILKGQNLYSLQLASLEHENLPLYADIGHEFGHALYWSNENPLLNILGTDCGPVFKLIAAELNKADPALAYRRKAKAVWIITLAATELFGDLIGFLVSGPAFLLSLHEMTWGVDQSTWNARLAPTLDKTSAYPSFRFRLHCLISLLDRARLFEDSAKKLFPSLENARLAGMASYLSTIPADHSLDRVEVSAFSDPDNDRLAIGSALLQQLDALKSALQNFVKRCWNEFLTADMKNQNFPPVPTEEVFQLLHRLEKDILPNIVPNNTLLGIPASFPAILNASAIYRIHVLSSCDHTLGPDTIYRDIQKVERLTAKALEVSYIQRKFNDWQNTPTP